MPVLQEEIFRAQRHSAIMPENIVLLQPLWSCVSSNQGDFSSPAFSALLIQHLLKLVLSKQLRTELSSACLCSFPAAIQRALCICPWELSPWQISPSTKWGYFSLMCLLRVFSIINNYNQNGLILEASYCFTVLCLIAFISTALVSQWLSETYLGFTLTQGKQNQTIFVRFGGEFEQVRQENENFNSTAKENILVFSCVGSWNFTVTLNKLLH